MSANICSSSYCAVAITIDSILNNVKFFIFCPRVKKSIAEIPARKDSSSKEVWILSVVFFHNNRCLLWVLSVVFFHNNRCLLWVLSVVFFHNNRWQVNIASQIHAYLYHLLPA